MDVESPQTPPTVEPDPTIGETDKTPQKAPATLLGLCLSIVGITTLLIALLSLRCYQWARTKIAEAFMGISIWLMAALISLLGILKPEDFVEHFLKQETEDCLNGQSLEDVVKYARAFKMLTPWWIPIPPIEEMTEKVKHRVALHKAFR